MRQVAVGLVVLAALAGGGIVVMSAAQDVGEPEMAFELDWATFLGGESRDRLREVIVHPDGSIVVGGPFKSPGMPVSEGAVQREYAGDDPALGHGGIYGGDAYLAHVSADGTEIIAATYFGGSRQERGVYGMLLDSGGNVVIGGATRSPDLPTTEGSYRPAYGGGKADMYAAKLSPDLCELLWCTYVGTPQEEWPRGGIAPDGDDNVLIVGGTDSP